MKFRMVKEYDPKRKCYFFWTERCGWETYFEWSYVRDTMKTSQMEAEKLYFEAIRTPEIRKEIIHRSWK